MGAVAKLVAANRLCLQLCPISRLPAGKGGMAQRAWTNTSRTPLRSPPTRLFASEEKATNRASAEMLGANECQVAAIPFDLTLTRDVVFVDPVNRREKPRHEVIGAVSGCRNQHPAFGKREKRAKIGL